MSANARRTNAITKVCLVRIIHVAALAPELWEAFWCPRSHAPVWSCITGCQILLKHPAINYSICAFISQQYQFLWHFIWCLMTPALHAAVVSSDVMVDVICNPHPENLAVVSPHGPAFRVRLS